MMQEALYGGLDETLRNDWRLDLGELDPESVIR